MKSSELESSFSWKSSFILDGETLEFHSRNLEQGGNKLPKFPRKAMKSKDLDKTRKTTKIKRRDGGCEFVVFAEDQTN